jgi:hypothetical protein
MFDDDIRQFLCAELGTGEISELSDTEAVFAQIETGFPPCPDPLRVT